MNFTTGSILMEYSNKQILDLKKSPLTLYIIKSGAGFFMELLNNTPYMTSDYTEATKLNYFEVKTVSNKLETLGFDSEVILIKIGKYR